MVKIDSTHQTRVEYHYDVDADANPSEYNSRNNRLMWYETIDTAPNPDQTLSKTYYVYTYDSTYGIRAGRTDGNPTRVITEQVEKRIVLEYGKVSHPVSDVFSVS